MGIAQIIYLCLVLGGMLLSANKHGKEKTGKENFWTHLIASFLVVAILYWGGFFTNCK